MLSTPVITTEVGWLSAKCRHSIGVTVLLFKMLTNRPSDFMPSKRRLLLASGPARLLVRKLRKCASITFNGIWMVSNLILVFFRANLEHVQVKGMWILVPHEYDEARLYLLALRRSGAFRRASGSEETIRIVEADGLHGIATKIQMVRLQASIETHRFARWLNPLVRPSNLVIRNTSVAIAF